MAQRSISSKRSCFLLFPRLLPTKPTAPRSAQGQNAAAIAESEVISLNTARTHISRIHRKMNVHNQQEPLRRLKEM